MVKFMDMREYSRKWVGSVTQEYARNQIILCTEMAMGLYGVDPSPGPDYEDIIAGLYEGLAQK